MVWPLSFIQYYFSFPYFYWVFWDSFLKWNRNGFLYHYQSYVIRWYFTFLLTMQIFISIYYPSLYASKITIVLLQCSMASSILSDLNGYTIFIYTASQISTMSKLHKVITKSLSNYRYPIIRLILLLLNPPNITYSITFYSHDCLFIDLMERCKFNFVLFDLSFWIY